MGKGQELQWAEAQKIIISIDLVAAARQQLKFLAAVDRNRCLYQGPVLDKAIFRYRCFWLPLLAKHVESEVSQGPLIVPLDCEWIWHCHRLNPVRYKIDCLKLYGKILDSKNVLSSVSGAYRKQSEAIWNQMYPNEPYELNMTESVKEHIVLGSAPPSTDYDLESAVKRQSSFFHQVSRPNMKDDTYLERAVARYKGFLYLIKRNKDRNTKSFCVPLYDIDLIWHSHQLNPVSYCKDLVGLIGEVLEHDDTDSDRSKGKKLDVGFSRTIRQYEETFGLRYLRAGAMYRGSAPSPLSVSLTQLNKMSKIRTAPLNDEYGNIVKLQKKMLVEVMLEIVGVRNVPAEHKGSLFVSLSKKQPDLYFNTGKILSINPSCEEKQVAAFKCETTGELVFQLMSLQRSDLGNEKSAKLLGTTSIHLQDLLNPVFHLSVDKWFHLAPPSSGFVGSKSISMRIAFSLTNPSPAPYLFLMVPTTPFSSSLENDKSWTSIVDEVGREVIRIKMRQNTHARKEVLGMTVAGEKRVLAEFHGTGWSLMNSYLQLQKKFSGINEHAFELKGSSKKVLVFPGRKLDYESKCCEKQDNFMTAVEFSEEHPHGKAVALLNLNSGLLEIMGNWMVMPGILFGFILAKEMGNDIKENENESTINKEAGESNKKSTWKKSFISNADHSLSPVSRFSISGHAHCGGGCSGGCSGACAGRCGGGGHCGGGGGGGGCGWGTAPI